MEEAWKFRTLPQSTLTLQQISFFPPMQCMGVEMGKGWKQFRTVGMLVCLTILSSCDATSEGEALLAMMGNWNANFPSWISGTDPCQAWEGIECNEHNHVTSLNLTNKGLVGPVPAEIRMLTYLTILDLSNQKSSSGRWNQIEGDLSAIGELKELQVLNLTFNALATPFPQVVLQLTNLVALRIDNCNLSGPFPTGLSNLMKLEYLYLGNNSMTGDLPSELGSLVNLIELTLWNNIFNSPIPAALKNLTRLRYLNLHHCELWGGLPPEFESLKSMQRLHLYSNTLTGPIPDTWQGMTNLLELRLQFNFLSGQLPSWLLSEANLKIVTLSHNQLEGPFPSLNNTLLETLKLDCNYLTGSWPSNPRNITLLFSGNCFSNITADNDNTGSFCAREGTCDGFLKQTANRGCPVCPGTQILLNKTLCICGEVLGTSQTSGKNSSSHVGIIVGPAVAATLVVAAALTGLSIWIKFKKSQSHKHVNFFSVRDIDEYWEVPKGVQRYALQDLARATRNFDKEHEIGSGGFGKVFYGTFDDGKMVAIKRASTSSEQGSTEFRNEVRLLSRLHHRNLVRLEGFCEEAGYQILVYEYVLNGNLHTRLFSNRGGKPLSWYKRLEIAAGVAEGLEYLHSFADPPVIHRDVKPSNILLDENLIAKVADFGLSRANAAFNTHVSTRAAGTAGYMDPQYVIRQQLTTASDVYAFGVVLLELVTGQRAIDHERMEDLLLADWARPRLKSHGIQGIADPLLGSDYPEVVYQDIAELALQCVSYNKEDRPSMKTVVTILGNHLQQVHPPTYEPQEKVIQNLQYPKDNSSQSTITSDDYTSSSADLHSRTELSSYVSPR